MSGLSLSSRVLWLIATAVAAFSAQAEEFSWQLSGVTSRTEVGDFDYDNWAVDGTYYVNPIDDGAGPNELASFLNPTTRVSAATSRQRSDWLEPTAYALDGAYVLPGDTWYVGASYSKTDSNMEESAQNVTRDDEQGYGLLAGRYLGANTTLELGLGRAEHTLEAFAGCPPSVPCSVVGYTEETTSDSVSLDVFHVRRFRSLTYSLQGSVSHSEAETDVVSSLPSLIPGWSSDAGSARVSSVAGELFPTDRLGVRVGYSQSEFDVGADADTYDVTATWFFKPSVAVQFGLSHTSFDDAPFEPESVAVRFIGRL
jgi:hypothetical protein